MNIRPAQEHEAEALSALALKAKAYWGYSADTIESWRQDLGVSSDTITSRPTFVAAVGVLPGVAAPKSAATASPSPAPSPTATPEPLDKAIPRLEARLKESPDDRQAQMELAGAYLQAGRADLALPLTTNCSGTF